MTEIYVTTPPIPTVKISTITGQEVPSPAYRHSQGVADNIWTINHNLKFHPNATVVDSAGTIVEGDIEYLDINTIRITFTAAFSGYAYLS